MLKRLKDFLERIPPAQLEPIEVRETILDEIEENLVEPVGDGRRRLCSRIKIILLSPELERRNRLRRALTAGGGLKPHIIARCVAENVEVPESLTIEIEDGAAPDPDSSGEFRTEGWTEDLLPREAPRPKAARLTIVATGKTIPIASSVFRIGRERQPRDRSGRLMPENHLHFGESETSISRRHAEIRLDKATGEYRLWDAGSTHGTRIVRDDADIDLPRSLRAPGELLREGDLICFGTLRVQFQRTITSTRARKAAAQTTSSR